MPYNPVLYSGATPDSAPGGAQKIDSMFSELYQNLLNYPRVGNALFERLLSINGAVLSNAAVDDSGAIMNALLTYGRTTPGLAQFPPGLTTNIASGLAIVSGNYKIDFNGLTINYTGSSGYAFTTSNALDALGNDQAAICPIAGFQLVGPLAGTFTSTCTALSSGGGNTTITDGTKTWATFSSGGAYIGVTVTHVPSGQTAVIGASTANTLTFPNMSGVTWNVGDAYTVAGNDATSTLTTADGLFVGAVTGTKTLSDQTFRDFTIRGFRDALYIGNQAFITHFDNFKVEKCWRYGVNGGGVTNSGENISFTNGNISNINNVSKKTINGTGLGIYIPAGSVCEVNLNNVSLDYSDQQFDVEGGQLMAVGGHLEDNHYGNVLGAIKYNSGIETSVYLIGMSIGCTEANASTRPIAFTRYGDNCSLSLIGCKLEAYNRPLSWISDLSGSPRGRIIDCHSILGSGATGYATLGAPYNVIYDPQFDSGGLTNYTQSLGTNNLLKPTTNLTVTNAGSGYANGTYTNVALTNLTGSGTGGTVNLTVAGGVVTAAVVNASGSQYFNGNTANVAPALIGGTGSGMVLTIGTAQLLVSSYAVVSSPVPAGATNACQFIGQTGNNSSIAQTSIPVRATEKVTARVLLNVTAYTSGQIYLLLRGFTNGSTAPSVVQQTPSLVATTGGYVLAIQEWRVPAGITRMDVLVYCQGLIGTAYLDQFDVNIQ